MAADEEFYARSLGRIACAQIVYAQAERLSESAVAAKSRAVPSRGTRPLAPSNVSATESVADALGDICAAFVEQLGESAKARAELSGRSKCNLIDVLTALRRMARITRIQTRDLAQYAMYEEIPFPHAIPQFPALAPPRKRIRDIDLEEDTETGPHIEPWMPNLPSAHTYVSTSVFAASDAKKRDRTDLSKQRRQVEKSLARLKESSTSAGMQAVGAQSENPFLVPPKVGGGGLIDEDRAGDAREPVEPVDDVFDARDSNLDSQHTHHRNTHESEAKRARVERVLAETGGISGVTVASSEKTTLEGAENV